MVTPPADPPNGQSGREFPYNDYGSELEYIPDGEIPLVQFQFANRQVPLFAPMGMRSWALLNLVMAILGAALATFLAVRALFRRRSDNRLDMAHAPDDFIEFEDENRNSPHRPVWLAVAFITGLLGILLFVLTQDMRSMMVLMDVWSIAHVLLLAAGVAATVLVTKRQKEERIKMQHA